MISFVTEKQSTEKPRKSKNPANHFKGTGLGTTKRQRAIAAKFPPEIDAILRSMPCISNYVREAVVEKLINDGLLPDGYSLSDRQ